MVHCTLILLLVVCSVLLVHSTLIDSSTVQDQTTYAVQTTSIDQATVAYYGQDHNSSSSSTTTREMQQEQDENSLPFTFPVSAKQNNARSCKGRQAKRLQRRYDKQFARWNATKPSCYTYTLERVCFKCPLTPVLVTVNAGVVVAGAALKPPRNLLQVGDATAPTMDELYAMLRGYIYDCQEEYIHQCRVKFARRGRGIITGLYMDEVQELTDDESEIYVRNFTAC
jgi:Family of unknown function (DUF6174)